jgi:hypothetical protein
VLDPVEPQLELAPLARTERLTVQDRYQVEHTLDQIVLGIAVLGVVDLRGMAVAVGRNPEDTPAHLVAERIQAGLGPPERQRCRLVVVEELACFYFFDKNEFKSAMLLRVFIREKFFFINIGKFSQFQLGFVVVSCIWL